MASSAGHTGVSVVARRSVRKRRRIEAFTCSNVTDCWGMARVSNRTRRQIRQRHLEGALLAVEVSPTHDFTTGVDREGAPEIPARIAIDEVVQIDASYAFDPYERALGV